MRRGWASEAYVIAALFEREGVHPFQAAAASAPYDLVADTPAGLFRVEVKSGKRSKNGRHVAFGKGKPVKADVLAIVVFEPVEVYYFKPEGSMYRVTQQWKFWETGGKEPAP